MMLSKGTGSIERDIAALAIFCARVKPLRAAPAE
jgi:hypothetical protein